jgi:DNA modification methylase
LRDYKTQGQIGLEDSPSEYIANLVAVFTEIWRVLRDDGTLWLNLGDCYTPQSTHRANVTREKGDQRSREVKDRLKIKSFGKPKDLMGMPWKVAFALQEAGWYLRCDIVWSKTQTTPESVEDRPTRSHEYIFLFAKQPRYYYDHNAIKERCMSNASDIKKMREQKERIGGKSLIELDPLAKANTNTNIGQHRGVGGEFREDGQVYRNKRSVWTTATASCNGVHFAVYPPKLIEPCILAGCPKGGTVLDPFSGSGTTGFVALRYGCNYIGIDLNSEYLELAQKRILGEDTTPVEIEDSPQKGILDLFNTSS